MASISVTGREFLLDVSRLIWRRWSRRLPTGIDRVCLEYVQQFGARSQAVVQHKLGVLVLSPPDSDFLFRLLLSGCADFRRQLLALVPAAIARSGRSPARTERIYLNVGHTGLDRASLLAWVTRNRLKAVYLIHDLIPITHPQFCREGEDAKHNLRIRNALASSAGLICNSEDTRSTLAEFTRGFGLPMPPCTVAWISGSRPPATVIPKSLERPYFVTLGTIEGRKNHRLLLQIWQSMKEAAAEPKPLLLIIGQRGWEADDAIEMLEHLRKTNGLVRELPHCEDQELANWVAGARALLMPSFAEGFGLPVIEALQLQVPVVASDLPVYREIVGDIPTYLDPLDPSAWEQAIRQFSADGAERVRQLRALRNYHAPTWEKHFAIVGDWLKSL